MGISTLCLTVTLEFGYLNTKLDGDIGVWDLSTMLDGDVEIFGYFGTKFDGKIEVGGTSTKLDGDIGTWVYQHQVGW